MFDIILKPIRSLFELNFRKLKSEKEKGSDESNSVSEVKDEINSIDNIYSLSSVAKEEVWKRWNDKVLRKKVEDFLKEVPEVFIDNPKAILFRNIATPNYESNTFVDLAGLLELQPSYLEFSKDKFCTRNKDKICFGKLCFSDRNDPKRNVSRKIIDMKACDNDIFCEIKTLWGEGLVDFHHRIFKLQHGDDITFSDYSYIKESTANINEVYEKFLALFICHGVLIENFIQKEGHYENSFTQNVVLPAFKKNFERFGVKPLIVPLLPINDEEDTTWMWYPIHFADEINNSI